MKRGLWVAFRIHRGKASASFAKRVHKCFKAVEEGGLYEAGLRHGNDQVSHSQRRNFAMDSPVAVRTSVLPVDVNNLGLVKAVQRGDDLLDDIEIRLNLQLIDAQHVHAAAEKLKISNIPVAFPTETVYGLGADATRSAAVRGIYQAKQRPADNPLIVHVASLHQLRDLLRPGHLDHHAGDASNGCNGAARNDDAIPDIYKPLISRFWPGPLTIILPNPPNSRLATEVTAGLNTFGARMPRHLIALALIKLSGRPIAAPSANASTKPSPTAAEHVAFDLQGRIETILDGGPCEVGVESTVVDGLSDPPLILRPGGVTFEQLRGCPGWEGVEIGYRDVSEKGVKPKAPGMKYRHYAPKATVVLFEPGTHVPTLQNFVDYAGSTRKVGLIRTKEWQLSLDHANNLTVSQAKLHHVNGIKEQEHRTSDKRGFASMLESLDVEGTHKAQIDEHAIAHDGVSLSVLDLNLGSKTSDIARGIFSALRSLDRQQVDAIFVEGISDSEGDVAAAVMNRLRKASEVNIGG